MINKPLLAGLIGFLLGGLLVSVAATTFDKPKDSTPMGMGSTTIQGKAGDDYDKAFLATMIEHHQGAIEMAKQSANMARHDEIKDLSESIITAQEKEISQMKQWQREWGY